jgi:hypothetical protein
MKTVLLAISIMEFLLFLSSQLQKQNDMLANLQGVTKEI